METKKPGEKEENSDNNPKSILNNPAPFLDEIETTYVSTGSKKGDVDLLVSWYLWYLLYSKFRYQRYQDY